MPSASMGEPTSESNSAMSCAFDEWDGRDGVNGYLRTDEHRPVREEVLEKTDALVVPRDVVERPEDVRVVVVARDVGFVGVHGN